MKTQVHKGLLRNAYYGEGGGECGGEKRGMVLFLKSNC